MTKIRNVGGLIFLRGRWMKVIVTVRTTSDKVGQSLSLAVEDQDVMIQIPIEPLKDMVELK